MGRRALRKMELEFLGELVFLLKTFSFVFLGISMRPADLWSPTAFAIIGLLLLLQIFRKRTIAFRKATVCVPWQSRTFFTTSQARHSP
jgi:NhaP-type Na+/H+ or K+/H+ antiporter